MQTQEKDPNDISIKIRTIDKEFMVDINSQDKIEKLKQKIENVNDFSKR